MTEKDIDVLRKEAEEEIFPKPAFRFRRGYGRDAAKFLGVKRYTGFIGVAEEEGYPPHTDHPALVYKNKQPVCFVSQPYDLSSSDFSDMVKWCERKNMHFDVVGFSVHYPGRTFMVRYWRNNDKN